MIRQPLLQVLQPQQQALLQQQQQAAATRSSATKSQIQQQFQHLPKLFKKIRLTIQYLQLITNQSLDMEPTTTGTNAQIEMEFEIEKYISKILKYSSPTNDENYDNGNAIPYPSLPKPPQHRPSTLTKVILNNKTTRKQMVELLCQKCGFCTSTITSIISNYTKYYKSNNNQNTNGDSEIVAILRKMYLDYVRLYNSEHDTLRPRSPSTLISIIVSEQWNILKEKSHNNHTVITPLQTQRTGTHDDSTDSHGGPIDYDECIKIIKQQRKILGESSSSMSSSSSSRNVTPKFWTTVTTGNRAFDTESAAHYQQLIQRYNERFPDQAQKRNQCRLAFLSSSSSGCPIPTAASTVTPTIATHVAESHEPSQSAGSPNDTTHPLYNSTRTHGDRARDRSSLSSSRSISLVPDFYDADDDHQHMTLDDATTKPVAERRVPEKGTTTAKKPSPKLKSNDVVHPTSHEHTPAFKKPPPPTVATATTFANSATKMTGKRSRTHGVTADFSSNSNIRSSGVSDNSLIGPWTCAYCTYYNTKDRSTRARCEICANIRRHQPDTTVHGNHKEKPPTKKNVASMPSSSSQSSTGSTSVIEIDC